MKLAMPRLSLLPRQLVALQADGTIAGYRLSTRWDGRHILRPAKPVAGKPCIAVVSHTLPFRRKLQKLPASHGNRLAMLKTAADEFPLEGQHVHYGLGLHGADGYLYALPENLLAPLREQGARPALLLVAPDSSSPDDCVQSLENYLRYGSSTDLLQNGRMISRRRLWQIALGAGIATALLATGLLVAMPQLLAGAIEWRTAPLRERGSALPALFLTTGKMAYAQQQAAALYSSPESRLPAALAEITATLPPGHTLRNIELKNGVLKIVGDGSDPRAWLAGLGFPADRITVEDGGSFKRFRAERAL